MRRDRDGHPPKRSPDARQVFRREGEYWTIVYEGQTVRLCDVRGLQHLAALLAHPHDEISALALEQRAIDNAPPAGTGVGLHDARERARVNVTRAITTALKRIAEHHPELGRHFASTICTGTFCTYTPDPRLPIEWES